MAGETTADIARRIARAKFKPMGVTGDDWKVIQHCCQVFGEVREDDRELKKYPVHGSPPPAIVEFQGKPLAEAFSPAQRGVLLDLIELRDNNAPPSVWNALARKGLVVDGALTDDGMRVAVALKAVTDG